MTQKNDQSDKDAYKAEMNRPRPIFLVLSLVFIVAAILAYMFDDVILGDREGSLVYVLLLIGCILFSVAMLMCYRNPRLGNKLLGYDALDEVKEKKGPAVFSTGFHFDSATDEKKIATRRREGRAARRKYAKATKAMQQQNANTDHKSEKETS